MDKFFVYLLESGLCLTLLYLGYVMLFRKETYFEFNRYYLLVSIFLSVLVPLIHISPAFVAHTPFEKQIEDIGRVKNYYEKLIYITDPGIDFYKDNVKSETINTGKSGRIETAENSSFSRIYNKVFLYKLIFRVYITGLLFFIFRAVYLFFWLFRYSKTNAKAEYEGVKLVDIKEEIPSFSFFRFVFINKQILTRDEFEQVIAHEKVHVRQKHSFDLVLSQVISVFQWFNPLVWRIQKSMKTIHEYIADRNVLAKGYKLFDYQSLLLSQLISIRSVELVNNFNLLSIKKRIAMMNKIKSGFIAKLKALFAIPIILTIFFVFADLTLDRSESNAGISIDNNQLTGSWISIDNSSNQHQIIKIDGNEFTLMRTVRANSLIIDKYKLDVLSKRLKLSSDKGTIKVKYQLEGNKLNIWWKRGQVMVYSKNEGNYNYKVVGDGFLIINRPKATQYRELDKEKADLRIAWDTKNLFINENKYKMSGIINAIEDEKNKIPGKKEYYTAAIDVNANADMKDVEAIRMALRQNNILKISYLVDPGDKEVKPGKEYGIPQKLPPMDMPMADMGEIQKQGIKLYKIDITQNLPDTGLVAFSLKDLILNSPKYIMKLSFGNNTSYNSFITYTDLVYKVFFEIRNDYSLKHLNKPFNELTDKEQNEVRFKYPITLVSTKEETGL